MEQRVNLSHLKIHILLLPLLTVLQDFLCSLIFCKYLKILFPLYKEGYTVWKVKIFEDLYTVFQKLRQTNQRYLKIF